MSKFKVTSYSNKTEILKFPDHYVALPVSVSDDGIVADGDGKKIVKAGTIVGGKTKSTRLNPTEPVAEKNIATALAELVTELVGNNNDLKFVSKLEGILGNAVSVAFTNPGTPSAALAVSLQNDGDITVNLATDAGAKATLETGVEGNDNGITWTSVDTEDSTNDITVTIVNLGTPDVALSVVVSGTDITVNLATDSGTAASGNTGVEGDNNGLTWSAQDVGVAGDGIVIVLENPNDNDQVLSVSVIEKTIVVNLATGGAGNLSTTAAQVIAAIEADASAAALVTVTDTGASTGAGIVTDQVVQLAGGIEPAISSTADEVKAAVGNSEDASALVTVTDTGASDGSGTMAAAGKANLAGGATPAITTTAAQIKAALEADFDIQGLVTISYPDENDGSGVVTAMNQTQLADGSDGDADEAEGVLLNDVDVTHGDASGAMVIHGFLDWTKVTAVKAISAEAEAALKDIHFIK